jgi:hypothetical protein
MSPPCVKSNFSNKATAVERAFLNGSRTYESFPDETGIEYNHFGRTNQFANAADSQEFPIFANA